MWVKEFITAEWRGAGPTSGLGVVPDLYKPKPKPKPETEPNRIETAVCQQTFENVLRDSRVDTRA
jgi:hypothetical protein